MNREIGTEDAGMAARGAPVRRAIFFVGVFYVVMVLLNGVSMQESASLTEYGWRRDALCGINRPFAALSRASRAHVLRQRLCESAGRWLNGAK